MILCRRGTFGGLNNLIGSGRRVICKIRISIETIRLWIRFCRRTDKECGSSGSLIAARSLKVSVVSLMGMVRRRRFILSIQWSIRES